MPENKDLENIKGKFPVPQGFRELLESLAREVLRGQPPNIYEFSALFFEYLLQKQSENEGECVIDNPKLYEEFKMELFTEALKQGMVSPSVGPMLGIDVVTSPRTSYVRDLQQQYAKDDGCRPSAPPASSTPDGFYDNYKQQQQKSAIDKGAADQIYSQSVAHPPPKPHSEEKNQISLDSSSSPVVVGGHLPRSHEKMGLLRLISDDQEQFEKSAQEDEKKQQNHRDSIDREKFRQNFSRSIEYSPEYEQESSPTGKMGVEKRDGENDGADSDAGFDEMSSEIASKIEGALFATDNIGQERSGHEAPFRNSDEAAVKIQAEIRGYLTRKHINEETGQRNNNNLSSEKDKNTVKIAANELNVASSTRTPSGGGGISSSQKHRLQERVSSLDSDHNHILHDRDNRADADAAAAATKIQAGVRGFLTRHRVHEMKNEQEKAAAKIQAGIRGHLTRKHLQEEGVKLKAASQATHSRKLSAPQLRTPKSSEDAAAKIQAGIRGYLTRKHLNDQGIALGHHRRVSYNVNHGQRDDGRKIDFVLDQNERRQSSHFHFQPIPGGESKLGAAAAQSSSNVSLELEDAAAKIQAGIRGFLTRKHMKEQLRQNQQKLRPKPGHFGQQSIELYLPEDDDSAASVDHHQGQLETAAVKIQANVRGYLTRHNLAKQKEAAVRIQSAYRGFQTRQDFSPSRHHQ